MELAVAGTPLQYAPNENVVLQSRRDPTRELTRYCFSIGDHIEPKDKIQLDSIGGWAGGMWLGASEDNGIPTMWRTKFMLLSGAITPLETRGVPQKADHRPEKANDQEFLSNGSRAYMVYAGDNMNYLSADRFSGMGIVELSALKGKNWETGEALNLQMHFFPEWNQWASRQKPFPKTIKEWESLIRKGLETARTQDQVTTGEEMLESVRIFRTYALNHIERNRQAIQSMRSVNTGGFYIGWNEKSRLYARQLEVPLEAEEAISRNAPDVSAEQKEDRELRRQELEMRREELKLQREQMEMLRKQSGMIEVAPTPELAPEAVPLPSLTPDVDTGVTYNVGDVTTVLGKEGLITEKKPFGKYLVEFGDKSTSTVTKADLGS